MRVTLVSYDDTPPQGGQGVEVEGMRGALESHDVAVITISGRGDHAITYPSITGRAPLDFSIYMNRHPFDIDATDPDVVHALGGPGGVLLTKKLRRPLVYTANHTYAQAHGRLTLRRRLSRLEAAAYRRAQKVLAISQSTADSVVSLGVDARKVEVLPPGIDVAGFDPSSPRDPNLALFVGRLETIKGALDAVRVFDALHKRMPDLHAYIAGTGALQQQVTKLAQRSPANIEVLGRVSHEDLQALYRRAAAVVMPSRFEGLGLVAAEAIANGAFVAGYDVDGLRDVVKPSGGGTLVPYGVLVGLAEAAWEQMHRISAAERASAAKWVTDHHSWEAVGNRLIEVYEALE
jgi:glycosyltransferase involved in cell wall biosynthesis